MRRILSMLACVACILTAVATADEPAVHSRVNGAPRSAWSSSSRKGMRSPVAMEPMVSFP